MLTPTPYDDTEPYRSIVATMSRFTFTKPITAEDLEVVRSELAAAAPGCKVTTTMTWGDEAVRVEVADADGRHVYGLMHCAV